MSNYQEEFQSALKRILKFVLYRPRSIKETRQKMEQLDFSPDLIEDLLNYMIQADLLNDEIFAKLWCESRVSSKKFGPARIKRELIQKGIDSLLIEEVIENTFNNLSQIELALSHLKRKFKKTDPALKQKYYRSLFNQGFDSSSISEALQIFLENQNT